MATIQMVPGEVYQDFQGTTYVVEENTQQPQLGGRLSVKVIFRKTRIMLCNDSRMVDGHWEFLSALGDWIRMSWSPMSYQVLA